MVRQVVDDVRVSKTTLARTCATALRTSAGPANLS